MLDVGRLLGITVIMLLAVAIVFATVFIIESVNIYYSRRIDSVINIEAPATLSINNTVFYFSENGSIYYIVNGEKKYIVNTNGYETIIYTGKYALRVEYNITHKVYEVRIDEITNRAEVLRHIGLSSALFIACIGFVMAGLVRIIF